MNSSNERRFIGYSYISTQVFSKAENSNRAKSTRNDSDRINNAGEGEILPWEHLEDVKMPGKTWDSVVSHTSTSRNDGDPNPSDGQTTMSRQDEE